MALSNIHLVNESLGAVNHSLSGRGKSHVFYYPCLNQTICTPYSVRFSPGIFRIEAWGASGGSHIFKGGKGAYASGEISFSAPTTLYLALGGEGIYKVQGSYNGGGSGPSINSLSGGGASDVRLLPEDSFEGLKSRILVAAGGGGSVIHGHISEPTGAGGDLFGTIGGITNNTGCSGAASFPSPQIPANQTHGGISHNCAMSTNGEFGKGGDVIRVYAGTGGGGYYGGSAGCSINCIVSNGGGGSSFISGHEGCNAILKNSTISNITHSGDSLHFSGLKFSNTNLANGTGFFSSPEGGIENGHTGNGVVRITVLLCNSMIRTCLPVVKPNAFAILFAFAFIFKN